MESKKRSRSDDNDDTINIKKKQILEKVTSSDSLLPTTSLSDVKEDFRVVIGTYERLLYGINAFWNEQQDKVKLEPIFIIPAHTGCIRTVGIGGHFLASGSSDEIIRLYDVKKRKEYGSLGGHHQGDITDIQFHGKYMLSCSDDHSINLWRTKDWEFLKTLKGHKGRVNSLAIHPTGKIALSVSTDRSAILWNLMTGRKASVNKLGRDEGMQILWNPAGDKYAILFDRSINIYNVADAKVAQTLTHRSKFNTMVYYSNYIITGHEDKTIRIWDTESGECIKEVAAHKLRVKALSILEASGKNILSSVSSDGLLKCWDVESLIESENPEPIGEYNTKSRATCIAAHPGFVKLEEEKQKQQEEEKKDKIAEKAKSDTKKVVKKDVKKDVKNDVKKDVKKDAKTDVKKALKKGNKSKK